MAAKKYSDVALEYKMSTPMACRYISYMMTRWLDSEELKCSTGYAQEWAERFLSGREYDASDKEGQRILKELGKK